MKKNSIILFINEILSAVVILLFGTLFFVFVSLCADAYRVNFYNANERVFSVITLCFITVSSVLSFIFLRINKKFLARIVTVAIVILGGLSVVIYYLKYSGFLDKITSVEVLREYVDGFGRFAAAIYILIQFLQVVILPIPSFVTIAAGVLLFGSLRCAVYSSIGIITGSIVSFLIGKTLGYKTLSKLFGKQKIDKLLNKIKGKDKALLTIMFLLPFFPDDLLCFVAGISSLSPLFFVVMVIITRIITVFTSSYSINNQIIPYDTWWGIILWLLFFLAVATVWLWFYRYGDKVEKTFIRKFKRKIKTR